MHQDKRKTKCDGIYDVEGTWCAPNCCLWAHRHYTRGYHRPVFYPIIVCDKQDRGDTLKKRRRMRPRMRHPQGWGETTIRFIIQEISMGFERSYVSFIFVLSCRRMAFEVFEFSRRNWEVKLVCKTLRWPARPIPNFRVTDLSFGSFPRLPSILPLVLFLFRGSVETVKQYLYQVTNYRWYMDSDLERLQIYFGSLAREEQGLTRIFMSQVMWPMSD